jgi:Lon-like ATP-dependent protease
VEIISKKGGNGMLYVFLTLLQLAAMVITMIYFSCALKDRKNVRASHPDFNAEAAQLKRLREISLTKPLTEVLRPTVPEDIIGQDSGMKALTNALSGANPQHIIIYGPPGVGKTAAARVAMAVAKQSEGTPFSEDAPFVEMDATIIQYDERAIADPLLGSVHDPIYQGAGLYGSLGIPRPKAGAVTEAHGGVLFIDEIGELNSYHLNRLLKVLEDGKVSFFSSYYSKTNREIPQYIHDIFKNGMPADFRLIGATTRRPEELPPALRSRCREIFFDELPAEDACKIAARSCARLGADCEERALRLVGSYCRNGRDSVNLIQSAWAAVSSQGRCKITEGDISELLKEGQYVKRQEVRLSPSKRVGVVNGLAVAGHRGMVIKIEASAVRGGKGLVVHGAAETEEINAGASKLKRRGSAPESAENALEVLEKLTDFKRDNYRININFPESRIIDGPSAGIAILLAVYSAVYNVPIRGDIALTGEIGLYGDVTAVGGVPQKCGAAICAGASTVYIPMDNAGEINDEKIVPISNVRELLENISRMEDVDRAG